MTYDELAKLLPEAAVEANRSGELVIYTGLAQDPWNEDGPLIAWCEECCSTGDLEPGDTCRECKRTRPKVLAVVPHSGDRSDG